MKWIGLTGGIGTGKSLAASILRELGFPVVDADQIAHRALDQGSESYEEIVKIFGNKILSSDLSIDRKILGQIVFSNKKDLSKLEDIIHPYVQKLANDERRNFEANGHKVAFYDVPLLFEKELQSKFDQTLLIYAPQMLQRERIIKRDQLPQQEVEKRIASQIPIEEKKEMANIVIENVGSIADLKKKIKETLTRL